MTRYLVGPRAKGALPSKLRVFDRPPAFPKWTSRGKRNDVEHVQWPGSSVAFTHKRGVVEEFNSAYDGHARVIARVFPPEFEAQLVEHDEAVARAEAALRDARAARAEFLEVVAMHAKPVRVEEARAELAAWKESEAAKAEEAKAQAQNSADLATTKKFLGAMNEMVGDFLGGKGRR